MVLFFKKFFSRGFGAQGLGGLGHLQQEFGRCLGPGGTPLPCLGPGLPLDPILDSPTAPALLNLPCNP